MSTQFNAVQTNYESVQFDPKTQIRVLVVEAGERDSPLSATFQICNIHGPRNIRWEAVSYTWDGQSPAQALEINRETKLITSNVLRILNDLRLRQEQRFLWIDAVCISQDNPEEKSQQVALMRSIYQEAQSVTIWFDVGGMEDAAAAVASAAEWMNSTPRPDFSGTSKPLVSLFISQNPSVEWRSPFHRMMTVRWFQRVWVVQEAALAKTLFVHLGQNVLLWDDFASTAIKFLSVLPAQDVESMPLEECYRVCQSKNFHGDTLPGLSMINLIVSLREWLRYFDAPLSPSELAYLCSDRHATVPSDKIYAVAGFFGMKNSSSPLLEFPIDYRLSRDEVFKNFTVWCIEREKNLDILAQQWHTPGVISLATWVTNWEDTSGMALTPSAPLMTRLRYSRPAAPAIPPVYRRLDQNTLAVKGFIIDEISDNPDDPGSTLYGYDPSANEQFLDQWLKIIPNNDHHANSLLLGDPNPTKTTLVNLHDTTWHNYPSFSHLWRDGASSPSVTVRDAHPQGRWAYVTKRGCLALTVGYLDGQVGYKICYLNGGRGLFVLKPESLNGDGKQTYSVVTGDCFVRGFEDGRGYELARGLGVGEEDVFLV